MFLEAWSSREITELQAFHILQNDEDEEHEETDEPQQEESNEPEGHRELTTEEILALMDADSSTHGRN